MSRVLPVLIAALVLAACGGATDSSAPESGGRGQAARDPLTELVLASETPWPWALPAGAARSDVRRQAAARQCAPGARKSLRTPRLAHAAVVRHVAVALRRPGGTVIARFQQLNTNRFPTVFGVLGEIVDRRCRPRWYRVQLPVRPNGSTGFVRASQVEVVPVRTRVEVDLSRRLVELYRGGRLVLRTRAAVGSSLTPTPTGSYYVNQRLVAPDPLGPFGPAALGISAFSPVLQDWIQGGPIAIHGTNEPGSIGKAASHGCLRVANATLRRLFKAVPAGTPVDIRA